MMLVLDTPASHIVSDAIETPRPRSLDLALCRMGFARRFDTDSMPRWPCTWSRPQRDESAFEWRPV